MIKIYITLRWRDILIMLSLLAFLGVGYSIYRYTWANTEFEISDELSGNIFPSVILSTAATDRPLVQPVDTPYVGGPKSCFSIKLRSRSRGTRVRIEVAQTPFFSASVSEFILPRARTLYTVYPDVVWNYEALRTLSQAEPVSVVVEVMMNGENLGRKARTFSMRSLNECLLGYMTSGEKGSRFVSTKQLFSAYVNEESPLIDQMLRQALDTRVVKSFTGYQLGDSAKVCLQVYALWHMLQKRHLQYSSVAYSSLSSNVVYSQRVRTLSDAVASAQVNCVDGSVLFASLLRAINIDPVLVRVPGHMFVGFYTDAKHKNCNFLETTMIGNVNLDDYFPQEHLDSTMVGMSQGEISRLTFEKSMEYARKKFLLHSKKVRSNSSGYMYLEITKALRRRIQPIGR